MDKQLSMIKKYFKNQDTIAYVHENEIILLKLESGEDGSAIVVEYILDCRTKRCLGKRNIPADELAPEEFEFWRNYFEALTQTMLNGESRETRKNVSLDALENTVMASAPSAEQEYLAFLECLEESEKGCDPRTRDYQNALRILNTVLNEKQRRWYLMSVCGNMSARMIAQKEGCAHTTVARGLKVIDKKIKKFLQTH